MVQHQEDHFGSTGDTKAQGTSEMHGCSYGGVAHRQIGAQCEKLSQITTCNEQFMFADL